MLIIMLFNSYILKLNVIDLFKCLHISKSKLVVFILHCTCVNVWTFV